MINLLFISCKTQKRYVFVYQRKKERKREKEKKKKEKYAKELTVISALVVSLKPE
jgi:hypothetical protein